MIIRGYIPTEARAVHDLITRAFGQPDEADLCDALRNEGAMALELVAERQKKIVGHVALSRMKTPDGWLALAPVSADPKFQGRGIGSALCQMVLQYANAPVVVLGDPAYYHRFGFDYRPDGKPETPFPAEYTGIYLPEGEVPQPKAKLVYPDAFGT